MYKYRMGSWAVQLTFIVCIILGRGVSKLLLPKHLTEGPLAVQQRGLRVPALRL